MASECGDADADVRPPLVWPRRRRRIIREAWRHVLLWGVLPATVVVAVLNGLAPIGSGLTISAVAGGAGAFAAAFAIRVGFFWRYLT